MKKQIYAAGLLRWTLALLILCVMPAVANASINVTLTNAISPAGEYPVIDGYTIINQGTSYTVSYGFSVSTSKTPQSVEATYKFGTRSGSMTASVSDGKINISPLRFSNLTPGDYLLSYTIKCVYTDASSEEVTGTADTGIRIMSKVESSVEKTEYDAVLSGTTVVLGPITMSGGVASGWNVQWSAGIPTGTNGASCRYTSTSSEYQVNTVTATVTNSMGGEAIYTEVYTFHIPTYGTPTARITGAPSAVYAGSQLTLHAAVTGGNPDGWHYIWNNVGGTDTPDYTFNVATPSTSSSIGTMRVDVSNLSPAGESWYSNSVAVNYTVYDQPTVEFPEIVSTVIEPGTVIPMTMEASGGDRNSWSYEWLLDGRQVSTNSYYSYKAPSTESVVVNTLVGKATNNASGVSEPYVATREYRFIVMPNGSSSGQTQTTATFSGTPVRLHVDLGEGESGWSYLWWIPALVQQEGNLPSTTNELMFDRQVSETTTFDVVCRAKTVVDGQNIEVNYDFHVTVYPTPSVTVEFNPDYESYIPGEMFAGNINVSGGDPNAWRYEWSSFTTNGYVNLSSDQSIENVIPDYNASGYESDEGDYKNRYIRGAARNRPEFAEEYYKNVDKRYKVYPSPTFAVGQDVYNLFSGLQHSIHIDANGGAGWDYVWTEDGNDMHVNASTITYTPVNNGNTVITKIYKVVATCWVPNKGQHRTVATEEHTFSVNVYPASTARFAEEYPSEILVERAVTMSVELADGNAANWNFSWFVNGALVSNVNGASWDFYRTSPGTYEVKVLIENRNDSELSFELSHTFNVYAKPSLQNTQTVSNEYVYSGTAINYTERVSGGYPDGWTWEVFENETSLASGTGDLHYTFVSPQTTSPTQRILRMIFKNSHDGADENVFELEKRIHVYARPSAALKAQPNVTAIGVGESILYEVETSDAPGEWTYEWTLDGAPVSTSRMYNYNAPASLSSMESHEVKVKAILTSAYANMSWDTELSRTIEVWPDGAISSPEVQNVGIIANTGKTIGVSVIGSLEGWTFEWTYNGNPFVNNRPEYYVDYGSGDVDSPHVFTVHATYERDGNKTFDRTYTINVTVYPVPECSLGATDISCYSGSKGTQTISYSGGNPDGWHTEWNVFEQTGEGQSFEFSVPAGLGNDTSYEGFVRLYNMLPDGGIIYDENFYFKVLVYTYGSAQVNTPDYHDFMYQANLPMEVVVEGGYPEGWSYRWYSADGGFDVIGGPVFTPETVNPNQTNMTLTVAVEIINRIGDEEGYHGFSEFAYELWPLVQVDETPSLTPRNVRRGEAIELTIGTTGGYPEGWNYSWTENGSYLSSQQALSYVPYPYYGSAGKIVNTIEYRVNVANLGPQNQTWYDASSEAAVLNVYGQPTAPSQVLVKGNGTSRTLIVMMDNADDGSLEEQGYSYVFGYTDYNGTDYSLNPTPYRYNHFTTEQFTSANNNFWAYTQWTYPDGSTVTSGKRYLSGYLDESFDASVYAGGRGDAAGIDAIEAGGLYSDGYSFRAEPAVPAEATVNVYSAAGRVVRVLHYPKQSSFDELIGLDGLNAGMYIVEVQVGGLRTIKKVVVDNK